FMPVVGNSLYSYAQISVQEGTHNLSSDVGFNAISYGFGSFESYGYAAGANLTAFGVVPIDQGKNEAIQTGCTGNAYTLTLKLPYQPVDINLDKGDGNGSKPITLELISKNTNADGETTYTYLLAKDLIFTQPNTYNFTVNVIKPTIDACGTGDEFSYDLIINPKPVAAFTAPTQSCVNSEVSFIHQTDPDEASITDYLWDFNGEGTSISKDPKFTFKKAEIKKVKFSIKYNTGCWSDVVTKDVLVVALPVAKFTTASPSCEGIALQFTDQSTTANGVINNWSWDFGDPTSPRNSSTIKNPTHIFNTSKNYNVTLTITTDLGCSQTIVNPIIIQPSAIPNFETPNICLDDAFAQFTNTTTISDNSNLTYQWDFGDPTSTTNTSTLPNPSHKYLAAADYNVILKVKSTSGCITEKIKTFTVNGSTPKSAFNVQNEFKLCSNQLVSFEDVSTIDFGQITRIEWYFDDLNQTVERDDQPGKRSLNKGDVAKIYTHQYPVFYSPAKRDIIVKMVTYSGSSSTCVSIIPKLITIYAAPKVEFNALTPVCQNEVPFQIGVSETTGLLGKGTFSGDGVNENGLFSPNLAGVGSHTITYTYLTDAGCSDSKSQDIIVYPIPVVNAGIDHTILIGGSVQLIGESPGANLTYKWSPSTGLDHDDILNPIASPTKDIHYKLTVTNSNGCQVFDEVFVKVLQYPEIPNTFTPNGDGVNDTWSIKYLDSYPSSTIKIFNRYGIDVFKADRYTEPWDGRLNGVDLPTGTYYYIITANNGSLKYTGSVLLVR
ncbi:MAG: gliding motility-associated C-terminal domain-containing protein, partial [Bacteroidetes bacterium]|nr:gliding motility-associated C-terminal domain-containing protein [Bacteroidota bacterium]